MICKNGRPFHQPETVAENQKILMQRCQICSAHWTFNKDSKGRVHNKNYLKMNVAKTAQPGGRTGKVFRQMYGKPVESIKYK